MKITEIKIRKTFDEGTLRGIVSVTIDDCLAIHDIKIVKGSEKMFIAMPSRKDETGVYRDIIHPIYPEARKMFEDTILEAYQNYLDLERVFEAEESKLSL